MHIRASDADLGLAPSGVSTAVAQSSCAFQHCSFGFEVIFPKPHTETMCHATE